MTACRNSPTGEHESAGTHPRDKCRHCGRENAEIAPAEYAGVWECDSCEDTRRTESGARRHERYNSGHTMEEVAR